MRAMKVMARLLKLSNEAQVNTNMGDYLATTIFFRLAETIRQICQLNLNFQKT